LTWLWRPGARRSAGGPSQSQWQQPPAATAQHLAARRAVPSFRVAKCILETLSPARRASFFMYLPASTCSVFKSGGCLDADEPVVGLARSACGSWLATVSASCLSVWAAAQHRLVLAQYTRHPASLESDGANVQLCWHPLGHTLAVSTSGSFVYLYQVQVQQQQQQGRGGARSGGGAGSGGRGGLE
jgi:hypothetical protein